MTSTCRDALTHPATPPEPPAVVAPQAGRRRGPSRSAPVRTGPPGRRDQRRPAGKTDGRTTTRPPVHRWFAEQLVLVLSGRRPAHALLGHLRGDAFDQVAALAVAAPLVPRGADRRAAALASLHARRLGSDVIEACARITAGGRNRAMAFRLEAGEDRRWRCSAVEIA